MNSKITSAALWGALFASAIAFSCSNNPETSGGSGDGDGDGDAAQGGDGGINVGDGDGDGDGHAISDGVECVELDAECESNTECCGGVKCLEDTEGTKRCSDESICAGAGSDCEKAADCCSLSCSGSSCDAPGSGDLCAVAGDDCSDDSDCCSNVCTGGSCESIGEACSSLGESCGAEGFSDGCCSKYCSNLGTEDEPELRCARSSECGARGEICTEATDCCSGVCLDGRCPTQSEIGGSLFAGEPCAKDSDCSSYACAATSPGGPKTCQFLGGCRPAGEICTDDWQCCSEVDISEGQAMCLEENATEGVGCGAHGIEGLSVCGLNANPKEVGEICLDTEGQKVHDCCPADNCEETRTGVSRCSGGETFTECLEEGEQCRVAAQCCDLVCSPVDVGDGVIELRCGSCVETDGLCTSDADCCGGICSDGTCDEETSQCTPLGGECTDSSECCNDSCIGGFCQTVVVR